MVTCRPYISFPVVKVRQYSNEPAEIHYKALRQVFQYLAQTKDHGITYWKPKIDHDLPLGPVPHLHKDSNLNTHNLPQPDSNVLQGSVDSDWAGDSNHRRSITAYALELAGGTVYYKT